MRLLFAAVNRPSDGLASVVVQGQVGTRSGTIEPALDAVLRFRDGCTDGMLGGSAVGIGRRCRNMVLTFEAIAEFVIRAIDMLAEDVTAGSFVPAEIARWAWPGAAFGLAGSSGNG